MIQKAQRGLNRRLTQLPFLKGWHKQRQFRIERDLINGRTHKVIDHPSILHFSVNKAATQYTKRIMLRCARENRLLPVQMSAYAWNYDFPYLFTQSAEENQPYIHIFQPKGYAYTVFGGFVEGIPDIEQYQTVIMVRDPRDLLVSGYYSYAHSHKMPKSKEKVDDFLEFRSRVQNMSVDEYALEIGEGLKGRLQKYANLCQTNANVAVLKYEDMIADFPNWLDTLLTFCQLQISASLRNALIEEANQAKQKKKEDVSQHRRQVTPGDHVRKLKPETISRLNEMFAEILHQFQYARASEIDNIGNNEYIAPNAS